MFKYCWKMLGMYKECTQNFLWIFQKHCCISASVIAPDLILGSTSAFCSYKNKTYLISLLLSISAERTSFIHRGCIRCWYEVCEPQKQQTEPISYLGFVIRYILLPDGQITDMYEKLDEWYAIRSSVMNMCQELECETAEHCMRETRTDTLWPFSELVVQAWEVEFRYTIKTRWNSDPSTHFVQKPKIDVLT